MIQFVREEDSTKETSRSTLMMAAAVAGFTNVCLSLPMDQVKSRLRKYFVTSGCVVRDTPKTNLLYYLYSIEQGSHYTGVWHVVKTIVHKVEIILLPLGTLNILTFITHFILSSP